MNDLQRIEPSETALQTQDPYALMRHALEKNVDVTVIERLSALAERWEASRAKRQFDESMSTFQSRCPAIEKSKTVMNKDGRSVRYKYAPLDSIVSQTKDLIKECGFSYTIEAEVDIASKSVKSVCRVTHCGGHSSESSFAVPIDPESYMTAPQKFASAMTFAKRYAFTNVFGILTSDEDTDTNTTKEKPAGPSSIAPDDIALKKYAKQLWEMLKPVRGDKPNWDEANKFMHSKKILNDGDESPRLNEAQFKDAIEKTRITMIDMQ